jgi:hypothetical protein
MLGKLSNDGGPQQGSYSIASFQQYKKVCLGAMKQLKTAVNPMRSVAKTNLVKNSCSFDCVGSFQRFFLALSLFYAKTPSKSKISVKMMLNLL